MKQDRESRPYLRHVLIVKFRTPSTRTKDEQPRHPTRPSFKGTNTTFHSFPRLFFLYKRFPETCSHVRAARLPPHIFLVCFILMKSVVVRLHGGRYLRCFSREDTGCAHYECFGGRGEMSVTAVKIVHPFTTPRTGRESFRDGGVAAKQNWAGDSEVSSWKIETGQIMFIF